MRIRRKHNAIEPEVDMTPMLDIVFIMLIFFIVTTSFVKESGITLSRPSPNQTTNPIDDPKQPIVLEIGSQNTITLAGRIIDQDSIRANVEAERARKPSAPVVVRAHESATTGVVIRAVDQSKLAGASQVTVVKPGS
ncbi:ExbD/TolR family protein [Aliikangiella coralliicola]|uniref:Biopolymer transporter ExbD n=1 Tax=Aliikangiella coralliicola TaxID=2592383 RepID=A0A545UDS6_9GAMM|nr:biopolymer transporter ExbD [Aliikangiella coralliicola]TQV87620.1 biopolymer transporter ExbD [Aliikangiella coralliicola]